MRRDNSPKQSPYQSGDRGPAIDPEMFGKSWWTLPLAARYASIDAHNAGLTVRIEVARLSQRRDGAPCITWRGTAEQFLATKTFPKGVQAKRRSGRWAYPGQLRGVVYPEDDGTFVFVIEHCNYYCKDYYRRHAQAALADENYRHFREAVLAGYPIAGIAGPA
jgi:hypothetical protein